MNHKHRKTLESLFSHPISGNITMKDVEHVFENLGAHLSRASGGKVTVTMAGHSANFHDHSHSLSKDEVVQIRKYLETCGVDASAIDPA